MNDAQDHREATIVMRTIAIGFVIVALTHTGAAAQTAAEQAQILANFEMSVVDYTQRHRCLDMFPEALNAATPAPRVFTPPVAMVFRQMIARALAVRNGMTAVSGGSDLPHAVVLEPFPSIWLQDFPPVLLEVLPRLPAPLEYRLIGHDLVVRDTEADMIVGVLRDAVGPALTRIR